MAGRCARVGRGAVHVAVIVVFAGCLAAFALLGLGPRTGRYQTATVLSASMRPTFGPGALVIVTPTPAEDLRVGDVIMYHIPVDDHRVVSHRIAEIVEPGAHPVVRTAGDANSAPDPWLAHLEDGPVWRVRGHVPGAGAALQQLRHPLIRRIAVQGAPALLAVMALWEIWGSQAKRGPRTVTDLAPIR